MLLTKAEAYVIALLREALDEPRLAEAHQNTQRIRKGLLDALEQLGDQRPDVFK